MEYDVTIDRDKFIGGSDLPVIMGISSFKTRWQLLLEKAGLAENEFKGNKYTEYGHRIEPYIREYVSGTYQTVFEPNQVIDGDFRGHTDGFNGMAVLEIKSTSQIYEKLSDYKVYLVQLIKYMELNHVEYGVLAVYDRPDDFEKQLETGEIKFDSQRLQIFDIYLKEYKDLLQEVNAEIDRFRVDLARLKENPLLSEEDFQPNELVSLSNKVMILESRMQEYKAIETEYKEMKQALFEAMQNHDIKSWTTLNGTKITRVDGTEPTTKTVTEFDVDTFATEHPKLYKKYCNDIEKKSAGRAGYVKITLPK